MTFNDFSIFITSIFPNSEGVLDIWHEWAKELQDMDNPDKETDPYEFKSYETFLGEIAYAIDTVRKEHGEEIAKQIIMLAGIPACPFPWEIKGAAEHLANGGDINDIPKMEAEGTLEDIKDYLTWSKVNVYNEKSSENQEKGFSYEIQGI